MRKWFEQNLHTLRDTSSPGCDVKGMVRSAEWLMGDLQDCVGVGEARCHPMRELKIWTPVGLHDPVCRGAVATNASSEPTALALGTVAVACWGCVM